MKRLILRISALGGVIALGLIGIAQARRGSEESTTPVGETPVAEATSLPSSEPPAVAVVVQPTSTVRTETVDARSAWPTDPRQPGLFPGAPQARPLGGDTYSLALDERGPVVQPAVLETSDPGRYAASALPGPELAAADASFADYAGATDQPNPLRPVAATDPDTTPPATPFPTDPYPTTSEVGAPSNTAYPTTSEVGAPGQFAGSTPAGASSLPPIPTGSSPPSYPVTASDYPAASAGASAMPTSPAPLQVAPLAPIGQPVTPVAPRTLQPITASPIANSTASGATTPGSFGPTSRMGPPSLIGQPAAALPHPSSGFAASPSDSFAASGGNDASQGTALPGDQKTEGPQSPRVTIEKSAPNEIQVGKPATFTITVRNGGEFPAAQ
ncbi:MAG: hypothetical protein HQ581_27345, partial [Planctomycetes bacterium]|nr:hypothetical protein [Planctomycetota bacterium]